MSYIYDPREMNNVPHGSTWEEHNRNEEMWHWGAMVLDLCDLPESEYKKPSSFIASSASTYGGGSRVKNTNVSVYVAPTEDNTIKWEWLGTFTGKALAVARVSTSSGPHVISATVEDNSSKFIEMPVEGNILSVESFAIGALGTPIEDVSGKIYILDDEPNKKQYTFRISDDESVICLTLIYILDGSEKQRITTMKYGDTIPEFSGSTEKEGYDFSGWKDSKGVEYSTMPETNLTLYGKHTIKKHTVTFILDGEEVSSYQVTHGYKATKFPSTSKAGYDFSGWEPATNTVITADTQFVGSHVPKTYVITWKISGTTTTENVAFGSAIVYPTVDIEGYTCTGWSSNYVTMPSTNLTITALLKVNTHVLSFYKSIDGNEIFVSSANTNYGATIKKPNRPSELGYTYSAWDCGASYSKMPDFDVKYVTTRTVNQYVLSYYVDGELLESITYDYKAVVPHKVYTKDGYTVAEWTNEPSTMPAHDVVAYCNTTINTYVVTFRDQDNNIVKEVVVEYGTNIQDILPEIEGYTFIVNPGQEESVPSMNITIVGQKTINQYPVVITIDGEPVTISLDYGDDIYEYIEDTYPASEGYHISISGTQYVPANESASVTVEYIPNQWTLSYVLEGGPNGTVMGNAVLNYGSDVYAALPSTSYEGYDFGGWSVAQGTTMPNSNLSVSGQLSIQVFAVVVKDKDNNATIYSTNANYGTAVSTILANSAVTAYVDEQDDLGYIISFVYPTTVTENLTIIASAETKSYILAFYNESTLISSAETVMGTAIIYPTMEDIEEAGITKVFKWDNYSYSGQNMPNHDVTIEGAYEEIVSLVYCDVVLNGSAIDAQGMNYVTASDALEGADMTVTLLRNSEFASKFEEYDNGDLDDDEWEEWLEAFISANTYIVRLMAPDGMSVSILNEGIPMEIGSSIGNCLIDGSTYNVYEMAIKNGYPKDKDVQFGLKITITE